jgi:hypothetical protein
MFDFFGKWWTLLVALLIGWLVTGAIGCAGPGLLSGVSSDIVRALDNPAVQKTLEKWAAETDLSNPEVEVYMKTSFGVRAIGVIVRGEMSGQAGTRGIEGAPLRDVDLIEPFDIDDGELDGLGETQAFVAGVEWALVSNQIVNRRDRQIDRPLSRVNAQRVRRLAERNGRAATILPIDEHWTRLRIMPDAAEV